MRVAIVGAPRGNPPMGLELAELRLLEALTSCRSETTLSVRVVGGRGGIRHARRVSARWIPCRREQPPSLAWSGADLVHLLGLDVAPPRHVPFVAMVHDLSPLRYSDEPAMTPIAQEIIACAGALMTPSRFIASELTELLDVPADRIRIIGSGPAFDASTVGPLSTGELARLGIKTPFAIRYGGYTARKNVPLLLEAWARVPWGTLVLVGPPQESRRSVLAAAPSLERVVVLDYVPQTLLMRLLRAAAALVSTSSYEGFGLPALEAMTAGTAVVAVRRPFIEEVCCGAAALVDPDPDALAARLTAVLGDEDERRQLANAGFERAEGFTWTRVAQAVLACYSLALQSERNER
jgi:glycosyltransferase involved in cell wall biosynthesis